MRVFITTFAVILPAILAGCAVGPDYHPAAALPAQPLPEKFSDDNPTNGAIWTVARPAANVPRGEWWRMFNDPELDHIEALAQTNRQAEAQKVIGISAQIAESSCLTLRLAAQQQQ